MGPIALFDKSFLQSISADESVWFDRFFMPIVCPIFYVETLGNLAKEATHQGPPEVIAPPMSMNALTGNIGSIATCPIRPCVHNDALDVLDVLVGRSAGLVLVHFVAPHAGKLGFGG